MWPYLTLLLVPAALASRPMPGVRWRRVPAILAGLALTAMIGLRHHVGCDWNAYLLYFVRTRDAATLAEAMTLTSPGYIVLNRLMAQAGIGIVGVNLVCAAILVAGLFAFCAGRPRPWLAMLIALPVLVMLAGFSATRQATALGCLLAALHLHLHDRRRPAVVGLMLLGATFHATVLLMAPILMIRGVPRRRRLLLLLALSAGLIAAVMIVYVPPLARRAELYSHSSGAWIRAIPSIGALIGYGWIVSRADVPPRERSAMFGMAALCLFHLPLGLASTTLMDRLGWYVVPFQMLALTRVAAIPRSRRAAAAVAAIVALPFAAILVGWLMLGRTNGCLIPYRSYLTQPRLVPAAAAATDYKYNAITDPWASILDIEARLQAEERLAQRGHPRSSPSPQPSGPDAWR